MASFESGILRQIMGLIWEDGEFRRKELYDIYGSLTQAIKAGLIDGGLDAATKSIFFGAVEGKKTATPRSRWLYKVGKVSEHKLLKQ